MADMTNRAAIRNGAQLIANSAGSSLPPVRSGHRGRPCDARYAWCVPSKAFPPPDSAGGIPLPASFLEQRMADEPKTERKTDAKRRALIELVREAYAKPTPDRIADVLAALNQRGVEEWGEATWAALLAASKPAAPDVPKNVRAA
jgi:hypothetical protein